eukprot:2933391-Prymnesium_polylepis.1
MAVQRTSPGCKTAGTTHSTSSPRACPPSLSRAAPPRPRPVARVAARASPPRTCTRCTTLASRHHPRVAAEKPPAHTCAPIAAIPASLILRLHLSLT